MYTVDNSVTAMDVWVGMLMNLMVFTEGIVNVRESWKEGIENSTWRQNHVHKNMA